MPPQSLISRSLTQNVPHDRFPNLLTLKKVVIQECVVSICYLVFLCLIFVHLIPCYELWMRVFVPDSIWIAVVALSASLAIQALVYFAILIAWQSIALLGAQKSRSPWNN